MNAGGGDGADARARLDAPRDVPSPRRGTAAEPPGADAGSIPAGPPPADGAEPVAGPGPPDPSARRPDRAGVALAAVQLLGLGTVLAGWTATSTAAGSVVVMVATAALFGLAARRRAAWGTGQGAGRAVWLLVATGYLCLAAARAWTAAAGRPVRGLDGLAAADWLAIGYPLLVGAAGLLLLRERSTSWLPGTWWDGAVVALGALALGAAALGWMLGAAAGGAVRASVLMGFPVLEVALSAGLLVTAAVAGRAATGLWWVSGGVALAASCDVAWYAAAIRGQEPSTAALEVGLAAGYALAGGLPPAGRPPPAGRLPPPGRPAGRPAPSAPEGRSPPGSAR